jgi:hypothetical protein
MCFEIFLLYSMANRRCWYGLVSASELLPSHFSPGKESLVYAGCEAGLVAVEKRKTCASAWGLTPASPLVSPVLWSLY